MERRSALKRMGVLGAGAMMTSGHAFELPGMGLSREGADGITTLRQGYFQGTG